MRSHVSTSDSEILEMPFINLLAYAFRLLVTALVATTMLSVCFLIKGSCSNLIPECVFLKYIWLFIDKKYLSCRWLQKQKAVQLNFRFASCFVEYTFGLLQNCDDVYWICCCEVIQNKMELGPSNSEAKYVTKKLEPKSVVWLTCFTNKNQT